MKAFLASFRWALRGIGFCLKTGRNFRIMTCAAVYVVWFGWIAGLTSAEWGIELLCCGLVLALEGMNTALEQLCDRVTRQRDDYIRRAKDCAAGAVLLASICAALIWLVIAVSGGYWRVLLSWRGGLMLLTLPAAVWWSFREHGL
ncbi:MAG: diacylglycerol kinase family protein [Candidatus Onthomonas sp.]